MDVTQISLPTLIFFITTIFYLLVLILWSINIYYNYGISKSIQLHSGFTVYFAGIFLENIVTFLGDLVVDLANYNQISYNISGPISIVLLFTSNLLFLFNMSLMYFLILLAGKGWCITKMTLEPAVKQGIIILGSCMMLVELLLVGNFQEPLVTCCLQRYSLPWHLLF